ncbi:hypothetical protein LTR09_012948 [Extremus antarcticus]|uniref:Uncharacterized protein n=1 Tax=Extremus antarcticus TaxID=702011 RepID=A0AAJ0G3J1_9PEZI|nr:hypothetical protein LTR09_012948 [Extremus antarcticus]
MSRAIKDGLQKLQQYVTSTKSRLTKIVNGQGDAGTRAVPAQTGKDDAEIGLRLDYGDKFTKSGKEYRRYKLQVNKQAANPTLKAMAAKNSHKVWAEADLQINPAPDNADQVAADFFSDLEKDLDAKTK